MAATLDLKPWYDVATSRHYHRNFSVVMHCHHYMSNFIDAAHHFESTGGPEILKTAASDTFCSFLGLYYVDERVRDLLERISIAEEYWHNVGMGKIRITTEDASYGKARMDYSHVDEGWLKKGKVARRPINYVTQGFLEGVMRAVHPGGRLYKYDVEETKSLALGDEYSEFEARLRRE
jgi:hypothetical protein